jgi:hypothetical protein
VNDPIAERVEAIEALLVEKGIVDPDTSWCPSAHRAPSTCGKKTWCHWSPATQ